MNKFDLKVAFYKEVMENMDMECDVELLDKITKGLGPSIFKRDAESVSMTEPMELNTVKENFLIKKLGLQDSPILDEAILKVGSRMGQTNRVKYRAIFYYLLVKEFGLESKILSNKN